MALGPRFSASKLQTVLKGAIGGGADSVRGALLHIGAQKTLQTGASVKDAKAIIQKLRTSGAIKDEGHAKAVFRQAERVANAAERVRVEGVRADRMAEFNATRDQLGSLAANIVGQHAHSVSVLGDKNTSSHSVSAATSSKKPEENKTVAPAARPILDIPFD